MMNLKEAVEYATTTFTSISASAKLDAQLLICHACNIEQTKIITYPEQTLSEQQLELIVWHLIMTWHVLCFCVVSVHLDIQRLHR